MSNTGMTLADFERLLDVYGGDRTRWPAHARAAAGQLVGRDGRARQVLAEAEALDRVLERAPLPSLAAEAALAERIVVAAQRSPRMVRIAGAAPPQRQGLPGAGTPSQRGTPWRGGMPSRNGALWRRMAGTDVRAAAALAVALAVGIFIGVSNLAQSALPALADLAGVDADRGAYNLASVEPYDEDTL